MCVERQRFNTSMRAKVGDSDYSAHSVFHVTHPLALETAEVGTAAASTE